MFENFSTQSRSEWIKKANQESGRAGVDSFPHSFRLDELTLESINTPEDISSLVTKTYPLPESLKNPLISVWIPHCPETDNQTMVELAIKQGTEDLFFENAVALVKNVALLIESTPSLTSLALLCSETDLKELLPAIEVFGKQGKIKVFVYKEYFMVNPENNSTADAEAHFQALDKYPNVRFIGAQGFTFGNAGATVVQELAYSLSLIATQWDQLSEHGADLAALADKTEVALGVGGDFYTDLVKFRAMRTLLHYLMDAYQLADVNPYRIPVRAITSTVNKTLYDPDANLLRNTTEALAATLGGAQCITLRPHDLHYQSKSVFGQRMALNIQHLLRHEAQLHQVYNPTEGSFFLDRATTQLVEKAWQLFLEVEKDGGVITWMKNGKLHTMLQHSRLNKQQALTKQKKKLVGVTRYANPAQQIAQKMVDPLSFKNNLSAPLEQLRLGMDQITKSHKPLILLVKPDLPVNAAQVSRRITYVSDIIISTGAALKLLDETAAAKLMQAENGASVGAVVLCGDDHWYQEHLPAWLGNHLPTSVVKMVVGKLAFLDHMKKKGELDVVLSPESNLFEFYAIVESMLPNEA